MYCGLVKCHTLVNRFLCRMFDLEYDRSCFLYNNRVVMIDLLPSATSVGELTLETFFKSEGVITEYLAFEGDSNHFQRTIESYLKEFMIGKKDVNTSIKDQTLGIAIGIRHHNAIMGRLIKIGECYQKEHYPIIPDSFGRATILKERGIATKFERNDLIELLIQYPGLHENKKENNIHYLLTTMVDITRSLMGLFDVSGGEVTIKKFNIIVQQLKRAYELCRSIGRVELPKFDYQPRSNDRVVVVTTDDSFKTSLLELSRYLNSVKKGIEHHDDVKIHLNHLIEQLDKATSHLQGIASVGIIKRDYSQKVVCVTGERSLSFNYEHAATHGGKRVLLSGEGLELLTQSELESMIRYLEEQTIVDDRFDRIRGLIVDRLAQLPS